MSDYPSIDAYYNRHFRVIHRHHSVWGDESNPHQLKPKVKEKRNCPSIVRGFITDYIIGKAPGIPKLLEKHPLFEPSFPWTILHLLNALFRAAGGPVFLENPLSGVLILMVICVSDNGAGSIIVGTALLGTCVAIAVTLGLLRESADTVSTVTLTFNGFLTGLLLADSFTLSREPWLLAPIIVGSALSVFLTNGLECSLRKLDLPSLNAPSIILVAAFNSCISLPSADTPTTETPTTDPTKLDLDWGQVLVGILLTPAQIYACPNIVSGCLIYLAMCINSPLLALLGLVGASLGSVIGAAIPGEYEAVYKGQWGTNPMLTAMALGGVLSRFNMQTAFTALAGATLATLFYGVMIRQPGFPVLAFPFIVSTLMLAGIYTHQQKNQNVPVGLHYGAHFIPYLS